MPNHSPVDEALLVRLFDESTLQRARQYVRDGRVLRAEFDEEGVLRGRVLGSRRAPYEQTIRFREKRSVRPFSSECTCPLASDCKHVAALLLHLLETRHMGILSGLRDLPPVSPQIGSWLRSVSDSVNATDDFPPEISKRLIYLFDSDRAHQGSAVLSLRVAVAEVGDEGRLVNPSKFSISTAGGSRPGFLRPIDHDILALLSRYFPATGHPHPRLRLEGSEASRVFEMILRTRRSYWEDLLLPPLMLAESREAGFEWRELESGTQQLALALTEGLKPLALTPPWYLHLRSGTCGRLETGVAPDVFQTLLGAPDVAPEFAAAVRQELAELLPGRPDVLPQVGEVPEVRVVEPEVHLRLRMERCEFRLFSARAPFEHFEMLPLATCEFSYGGHLVTPGTGADLRVRENGRIVIYPRNFEFEAEAPNRLVEMGWRSVASTFEWKPPKGYAESLVMRPDGGSYIEQVRQRFFAFVVRKVPILQADGWHIELPEDISPPAGGETWLVRTEAQGEEEFDLHFDILLGGKRYDLVPIVAKALRTLGQMGVTDPDSLPEGIELFEQTPDGQVVSLPGYKLRPILKFLLELFGPPKNWAEQIRRPNARAHELSLLESASREAGLKWQEPAALRALRKKIEGFEHVADVEPPAGLKGNLRPYQRQGLAWLQFLRQFGFSGVLADDMGLGKTIQTLAHILVEQEAGRLNRPVLIVAPTSTLPNWRHEVERFAPSLRSVVYHGQGRKEMAVALEDCDVILTSYPLLSRDRERLKGLSYHLVVLDEAQNVKNASTAAAKAACELNARHRLCLSGTPVENHLEELWSLFHFLMPGFLDGLAQFRRDFRIPIEKQSDDVARRRLIRRIRPFILRRVKQEVAKELPPKTEVIERIALSESQRNLYEGVRLAMDERVRELLAVKGLEKSRIEILDALLKLRQVCCDPRLVKLDSAREVTDSAKLDRLLEMLEDLLASGRRVLVFSQFTSMLDLIERRLREASIEWVRISGDTDDRETPVKRFQAGEVPVFLISLRAGGTGLNLTAADTVIHYDPWWNPAVERQATDRAHRIGQDKPVFVFKLVAENTVEERICELQSRKAELAESLLADGADPSAILTADELRHVFDL